VSCKVCCNRREELSEDRERGHNSVTEGGKLLVHLAKVTSVNIVFEITSHTGPIEMFGGLFEALVCSHMGHLFMGDSNSFHSQCWFLHWWLHRGHMDSLDCPPPHPLRRSPSISIQVGWLAFLLTMSERGSEAVAFRRLLYHLPLRCWESWKARISRAREGWSGKGSS